MRLRHLQRLAAALIVVLSSALVGAADDAKPERVRGRVVKVRPEEGQIVVRTDRDREVVLRVDPAAEVRVNGKDAKVSDLKEGTRVRVRFHDKDGVTRAVSVTAHDPATAGEVKRAFADLVARVRSYTVEQKDEYCAKMEEGLDDLQDRIDVLEDRAKEAGADLRREYDQEIQELRRKEQTVRRQLDRAKDAAPAAWEDVKHGVRNALDELQTALDKARSRFR
jgi:hypothetical protein